MIKKVVISIIFIFLFSNYSFAYEDGDFQYWSAESVSWKIAKDCKMELEEEFRFGDDMSDFYHYHTDIGATYSGLADWLDVGVNYWLSFEKKNNKWKYENRPHFNATLKYGIYGFDFSTRNRFEYRDKEDESPFWRYRNKFTIKLPKFTKLEIQPYIAEEIFVDFKEEELNSNRVYGGVYLKILENLRGEIYYLWQSSKSNDDWLDTNILGTKIKLSF